MPKYRRKVINTLAITIFIAGVFMVVKNLNHHPPVIPLPVNSSQEITELTASTRGPAETLAADSGVADQPSLLLIEKVGVSAQVVPVGLASDNTLQAPNSIHDVGWYKFSAKAGETGAVVLDGHVSGPNAPGVFKHIHSLMPGDLIILENDDKSRFLYRVAHTEQVTVDEVDMAKVLSPIEGSEGLNFITCAGTFNRTTQAYADRLIIYAVRT